MNIKKILTDNISLSELHYDLEDELGLESLDGCYDIVDIGKGICDAYPIKIDHLIESLNNLKEKGSTHVSIEDHCDHVGYDLSGFYYEISNDEEAVKNKEKLVQKQIEKLQEQIDYLKRN